MSETMNLVIAAHNAGKFAEAERLCQAMLKIEPAFVDGLRLLALKQKRDVSMKR
jgi:hypothetical protein